MEPTTHTGPAAVPPVAPRDPWHKYVLAIVVAPILLLLLFVALPLVSFFGGAALDAIPTPEKRRQAAYQASVQLVRKQLNLEPASIFPAYVPSAVSTDGDVYTTKGWTPVPGKASEFLDWVCKVERGLSGFDGTCVVTERVPPR